MELLPAWLYRLWNRFLTVHRQLWTISTIRFVVCRTVLATEAPLGEVGRRIYLKRVGLPLAADSLYRFPLHVGEEIELDVVLGD